MAAVVGVLLFTVLASSISLTVWSVTPDERMSNVKNSVSSVRLGEVFLGLDRVTPQSNLSGTGGEGHWGRTRVAYLLPFEIVSVHLLVVLIGAAYLARAKRRQGASR